VRRGCLLPTTNKALFLDRDGVINIDYGYVYKVDNFHFRDGIFDFVQKFYKQGFHIFVITNQSGIARGYYLEDDFLTITKFMESEFLKNGIKISKVYYCPCHPNISQNCECRKPKPTMILQAKDEFQIDLSKSILVGDKLSDIESGKRAGVGQNFLLAEGGFSSFEEILQHINLF